MSRMWMESRSPGRTTIACMDRPRSFGRPRGPPLLAEVGQVELRGRHRDLGVIVIGVALEAAGFGALPRRMTRRALILRREQHVGRLLAGFGRVARRARHGEV